MAEALAVFGAVVAGAQLAELASKIVHITAGIPSQRSSTKKLTMWLCLSQSFSVSADQLYLHFAHKSLITTHLIDQFRQEAKDLALLLQRFTVHPFPAAHRRKLFVFCHEKSVCEMISSLRNNFL
jgi:hypothetical protein